MQPVEFKEQTGNLARPADMSDERCGSLPVFQGKLVNPRNPKRPYRYCLSCWRMGWRERLGALLHGRVWVWVISGSESQPPICLSVERSPFTAAK